MLEFANRWVRKQVDRPGYSREIILLILLGILAAPGPAYVASKALDAYQSSSAQLQNQFFAWAVTPLLTLLVLWLWYTVVAHLVAGQLRGRGPVGRLSRGAAWAIVPVGIWYLIRTIAIAGLFFTVEFEASPEGAFTPEDVFDTYLSQGLDSPVYLAVMVLGLVFIAWSWQLLTEAVEAAKDLSTDAARQAAAVPVALYALYFLWQILQQAELL